MEVLISMETKICTKCGRQLPISTEYFKKNKTCKYGLSSVCKECQKKLDKQYRDANKNHIKEYLKQWAKNNNDHLKKYRKHWYEENKEYYIQYYEENIEHIKQYRKDKTEHIAEYNKEWAENNKDYRKEYFRKYYEKNKENYQYYQNSKINCYLEYKRKWKVENKELVNNNTQKRRTLKKSLPATFTVEQWEHTKAEFDFKCCYCGKKEFPLVQDHFIPLSKGGGYESNNIVPACSNCNGSKNNKDFFYWYPTYEFYDKIKLQKILEFLELQ